MRRVLEQPEAFPIRGLFDFRSFQDDILSYYGLKDADERRGVSTGWSTVDEYYRVVPGELTIVTGVPNSGKSEWIDALLYNISASSGWCFALCSMEKKAREHGRQLLEKHVGKPFFDAPYARGEKRMSQEEVEQGLEWLGERFFLIRHEDEMLPNIDWILDIGRAAVMRYGIRGLVIDPYNELDHQRPDSRSETEYVSQMLTKIKRLRLPRLVRGPPQAAAELEGGGPRLVRHQRLGTLHQQGGQRLAHPQEQRHKRPGHHETSPDLREESEEQGGGAHRGLRAVLRQEVGEVPHGGPWGCGLNRASPP